MIFSQKCFSIAKVLFRSNTKDTLTQIHLLYNVETCESLETYMEAYITSSLKDFSFNCATKSAIVDCGIHIWKDLKFLEEKGKK